jgi:hypothetical protein
MTWDFNSQCVVAERLERHEGRRSRRPSVPTEVPRYAFLQTATRFVLEFTFEYV